MDYYAIYGKEYLAHHGILGQKWGQRNGPPYPLNPEDHSKAEKEASKKAGFYHGLNIVNHILAKIKNNTISTLEHYVNLGKKYSRSYDLLGFSSDLSNGKSKKASEKIRNAISDVNPSGIQNHCPQNALASCIKYSGIKGLENIQINPKELESERGILFEKCFKLSDGSDAKSIHLSQEINSAADATKAIIEAFNPKEGSCGMLEAPLKRGLKGHAIMWCMEDGDIKYSDPFFRDVVNNGYVKVEDASTYFGNALYNKYNCVSCLDDVTPNYEGIDKYFKY